MPYPFFCFGNILGTSATRGVPYHAESIRHASGFPGICRFKARHKELIAAEFFGTHDGIGHVRHGDEDVFARRNIGIVRFDDPHRLRLCKSRIAQAAHCGRRNALCYHADRDVARRELCVGHRQRQRCIAVGCNHQRGRVFDANAPPALWWNRINPRAIGIAFELFDKPRIDPLFDFILVSHAGFFFLDDLRIHHHAVDVDGIPRNYRIVGQRELEFAFHHAVIGIVNEKFRRHRCIHAVDACIDFVRLHKWGNLGRGHICYIDAENLYTVGQLTCAWIDDINDGRRIRTGFARTRNNAFIGRTPSLYALSHACHKIARLAYMVNAHRFEALRHGSALHFARIPPGFAMIIRHALKAAPFLADSIFFTRIRIAARNAFVLVTYWCIRIGTMRGFCTVDALFGIHVAMLIFVKTVADSTFRNRTGRIPRKNLPIGRTLFMSGATPRLASCQ